MPGPPSTAAQREKPAPAVATKAALPARAGSASRGSGGAGGEAGGGSEPADCEQGLIQCDGTALGECIDPLLDPEHCGDCGIACGAGFVCSAGTCALSCQAGLVECNGLCINPRKSLEHCGAGADCSGGRRVQDGRGVQPRRLRAVVPGGAAEVRRNLHRPRARSGLLRRDRRLLGPRRGHGLRGRFGLHRRRLPGVVRRRPGGVRRHVRLPAERSELLRRDERLRRRQGQRRRRLRRRRGLLERQVRALVPRVARAVRRHVREPAERPRFLRRDGRLRRGRQRQRRPSVRPRLHLQPRRVFALLPERDREMRGQLLRSREGSSPLRRHLRLRRERGRHGGRDLRRRRGLQLGELPPLVSVRPSRVRLDLRQPRHRSGLLPRPPRVAARTAAAPARSAIPATSATRAPARCRVRTAS